MQPVNHDIDDLMRRAAEDYPVKPQGMDWEKVAQQLATPDAANAAANRYGGLKKLLFLLPFIFASFVCDRFLAYEYGHLKKSETTKQNGPQGNQTNTFVVTKDGKPSNNLQTMNVNLPISKMQSFNEPAVKNNHPLKTSSFNDVYETNNVFNNNSFPVAYEQANLSVTSAGMDVTTPQAKKLKPIVITPKAAEDKNKAEQKTKDEKAYVSLLMGPDFSRVKSQQVKPAGYNLGMMGGYWFAKRWAVEAGVLWDRKNYYSTGEYFKTDKVQLPQHTKVMQVDGYCAMFEIPVNVRYKAWQGRRDAVTLSSGLSSYLMHREDYNYVAQRYGVTYTGNTAYNHASKNWFSVVNLSLGYEHQLGQKLKIHVEPYFKLPIKGVGIGSLPLSSKGVLVGITYPIH